MSVYFISDLHLSEARPDLVRAFCFLLDELDKQGCQSLYILGDFYEAYIGDDYQSDIQLTIELALRKFNSPVPRTYFLPGNRDFLVGETWAKRTLCRRLDEQSILPYTEANILLCHGDEFCIDDEAYQSFRSMVRTPQWQQNVLALPIEQRLALAQQLRNDSKQASSEKSNSIMDVNLEFVRETCRQQQVNILIHGHTHRPALHDENQAEQRLSRLVLGDWDTLIWYANLNDTHLEQYSGTVEQFLKDGISTFSLTHRLSL